jgi:flagellin
VKKELGIAKLSIANRNVPLTDWIKYAVVESNWSKSSTGVFKTKDRLHLLRTQTPHDRRPSIVTETSNYRSQLLSFQTAGRNINEAVTLLSIFTNSLGTIDSKLDSMKTLATAAANSSITNSERSINDLTYSELATELDDTAQISEYQGISLLSGTPAALRFQVSIRGEGTHQITLQLPDMTVNGLFGGSTSIATEAGANTALAQINVGIGQAEVSQSESNVVLQGLTGSGNMNSRVVSFITQKLESIADKPIDQKGITYVLAELLEKAEVAILAQDPTRLDEYKGAVNSLELLEEKYPPKLDLYSLDPKLKFAPRANKPYLNIDGTSGVTARTRKAPFWNLPESE